MSLTAILIKKLTKQSSYHFESLPDFIQLPARDELRHLTMTCALADATVDQLAFAIQRMEAEQSANFRRLAALRELYERARKQGALGAQSLGKVFVGENV
jgi:hypothetical protein